MIDFVLTDLSYLGSTHKLQTLLPLWCVAAKPRLPTVAFCWDPWGLSMQLVCTSVVSPRLGWFISRFWSFSPVASTFPWLASPLFTPDYLHFQLWLLEPVRWQLSAGVLAAPHSMEWGVHSGGKAHKGHPAHCGSPLLRLICCFYLFSTLPRSVKVTCFLYMLSMGGLIWHKLLCH